MGAALPGFLRYRVVNPRSGVEITNDLPHLNQSQWTTAAMIPGNPGSAATGSFTVPLHPPGSPGYKRARSIYDQLEKFQRIEGYLGYSAKGIGLGGDPYRAGIIRKLPKSHGSLGDRFELSGESDLALAALAKPFPGELLSGVVTSDQLKSFMGLNELGWADNFNPFTAANYNSSNLPAHTAGAFSGATDPADGLLSATCGTGSGAAFISKSGASAADRWHSQMVEVTGHIVPTNNATNGGVFGVGLTNANSDCQNCVVAWVVARFANGRYNLDVTLAVYLGNALNGSVTVPNALLNVDDPQGYIPVTISLLAYDGGGFAGHSNAVVVNGKTVITNPSNYDPGTATRYPFLLFGTPLAGSASIYQTNLTQFTRFSTDGPAAASVFIPGASFSAATHSLPATSQPPPTFLEAWATLQQRDGWFLRYTPKPFKSGVRTLGTLDFAADPGADLATNRKIVFSREGGALAHLDIADNADPFSTSTSGVGPALADGGGVAIWRDVAALQHYGVIEDTFFDLDSPDFTSLRSNAARTLGNKTPTGLSGAKSAIIRRTLDTADKWRELDQVVIHDPEQGAYMLTARVCGMDFEEGKETQRVSFDQFSNPAPGAIHVPVLNKRVGQAAALVGQQVNRYSNSTLLVDQSTGTINQFFTGIGQVNATDITNSTASFTLTKPSRVLVWAQVDFANNAGFTDFVYIIAMVDGVQVGKRIFIGQAFEGVCETIQGFPNLIAGNHTVKLVGWIGAAGNQGICYLAEIFIILLGT